MIYSRDYETVFVPDEADLGYDVPFLSPLSPNDWARLVRRIEEFDFSSLDFDVIGQLYERLIDPRERRRFGQFYTSPDVVDLINAFCIREPGARVLDPACGGGTFLVRAYARKRTMAAAKGRASDHQRLLGQVFGIDIGAFPAQLSTINLAVRHLSDESNYPRVAKASFFDAQAGIPLYDIPLTGESARSIVPEDLDAVIGNPPYIRQEMIDPGRQRQLPAPVRDAVAGTDQAVRAVGHLRLLLHPRGPSAQTRWIPGFHHQHRLARHRLRVPPAGVLPAEIPDRRGHRVPGREVVRGRQGHNRCHGPAA